MGDAMYIHSCPDCRNNENLVFKDFELEADFHVYGFGCKVHDSFYYALKKSDAVRAWNLARREIFSGLVENIDGREVIHYECVEKGTQNNERYRVANELIDAAFRTAGHILKGGE